MRQVIVGGLSDLLNNGATEYNSITGCQDWSTNENLRHQLISADGTIKNLIAKLDGVAGDGKTWTFTVMINGSASALACSISGDTDTEGSDTSSTVSVSAGDEISIRSTSSGTPTNRNATWAFEFSGDTAKESLFLGFTTSFKSQARFCAIAGVFVSAPDEFEAYQIMPTAGKIKNLYVKLTNNPGTDPDAYRYTLRLNQATTDLTTTITGAARTGNDTSNEITVAAGDSVGLYIEPLNSPSNDVWAYFGFTFVADIDGESCVLGGQFATPSTSVTNFMTITTSTLDFGTSETTFRQLANNYILKKFYVEVTTDPGSGKSWDITVRKNEASTAITVNISGTDITGNDTTNNAVFLAFDYVTIEIVPTSTPDDSSNGMKWGVVMVVTSVSPDPSRTSSALVRVTALVQHWSAGPGAVYQTEILTGGLFSQYFSPISPIKEPEPTLPELIQTRQPARQLPGPIPTLREYGLWLGSHTQAEQRAILRGIPGADVLTLRVWQEWVVRVRSMGQEIP